MTTKPPTPQGISRLLAKDFPRATERPARAGFSVRGPSHRPGEVLVNHWSMTYADTRQRDREALARYAEAIDNAGYTVKYNERRDGLIVTAGD